MVHGLASNSTIEVTSDMEGLVVKIPPPAGGLGRYAAALFHLVWLAGWAVGWVVTSGIVFSGGANSFLVFWLVGWTVAGAVAIWQTYRILQPAVPEMWRLESYQLHYDSGITPLEIQWNRSKQAEHWKALFRKRIRATFDRQSLGTLTLREFENGNRLTIDHEGQRLDLATAATEIERERLYEMLKKQYQLP